MSFLSACAQGWAARAAFCWHPAVLHPASAGRQGEDGAGGSCGCNLEIECDNWRVRINPNQVFSWGRLGGNGTTHSKAKASCMWNLVRLPFACLLLFDDELISGEKRLAVSARNPDGNPADVQSRHLLTPGCDLDATTYITQVHAPALELAPSQTYQARQRGFAHPISSNP